MRIRRDLGRRAFLAASTAALVAPTALRAAPGDPISATVGIPPGHMGAIVLYAQERGFFKNAGLDIHTSTFSSGAIIATAVTGGSLDFGAVNVGSLASARLRGVPLKIVASASIVPNGPYGDQILVRKDSPIRTGADFNGKTVAIVALKTVQNASFYAWLEKHGGDPKTVKMFEIPLPEMAGALAGNRVDAAITVEPFTTEGLTANRSFGNVYAADVLPFMVFAMCATDQWLAANPATAVKFASAIRAAALWANGHEKDARALLGSSMKLDPSVTSAMLLPTSGTSLDPALVTPVIDIMVKYGFLEKAVTPAEMIWRAPS